MKVIFHFVILFFFCAALKAGDYSGKWAGQYQFTWQNGKTSKDSVFLTLRQFDKIIEGTYGPNFFIQNRFKQARLNGDTLICESGGMKWTLTLNGDELEGNVFFPGEGAPQTTVKLHCVEPGNGDAKGPLKYSVVGNLVKLEDFYMPQLDRKRNILILLPDNYENSGKRYPVIYMQDGQNLFNSLTCDREEWMVDETLDKMSKGNNPKEFIIVGIEHGGQFRSFEYMPASLHVMPDAQGEKYAEFVAKTLKPYIDEHYRTKPEREFTAVAGSSAGAQISFFIGTEYPDIFSKVGTLGFVMGANAKKNIDAWGKTHSKYPDLKMYLHVSTEEYLPGTPNNVFVDNLKILHEALTGLGYSENEVMMDIEPGGHHNEATWSKRFPLMLEWLFN